MAGDGGRIGNAVVAADERAKDVIRSKAVDD
jgi:hypothetical protein